MYEHDVTIYVSDDNEYCSKVIELVKEYNVSYELKNVSRNKEYMKELQSNGVYGTPAIFVKGEKRTILGYQREKIRQALSYAERL